MSRNHKPTACTLAWLAVVALVLFGAPTQNRSTAHRGEQEATLTKLAAGIASGELAQSSGQRTAPAHKLLKPWEFLSGPESFHTACPTLIASDAAGLSAADLTPPPRGTLVGIVELRI